MPTALLLQRAGKEGFGQTGCTPVSSLLLPHGSGRSIPVPLSLQHRLFGSAAGEEREGGEAPPENNSLKDTGTDCPMELSLNVFSDKKKKRVYLLNIPAFLSLSK